VTIFHDFPQLRADRSLSSKTLHSSFNKFLPSLSALLYVRSFYNFVKYEGNSISKLQIQVATYVFELSAGNCHR
jgi:hypothetical protein